MDCVCKHNENTKSFGVVFILYFSLCVCQYWICACIRVFVNATNYLAIIWNCDNQLDQMIVNIYRKTTQFNDRVRWWSRKWCDQNNISKHNVDNKTQMKITKWIGKYTTIANFYILIEINRWVQFLLLLSPLLNIKIFETKWMQRREKYICNCIRSMNLRDTFRHTFQISCQLWNGVTLIWQSFDVCELVNSEWLHISVQESCIK